MNDEVMDKEVREINRSKGQGPWIDAMAKEFEFD
jgi:hypothetical protein